MPALSVIVPATDGPPTLARCVDAIRSRLAGDDELIVVAEPAFSGPAHARNRGAAEARNEVLVFVDSDVELHVDALDRIRRTFVEQPELDAVFGSYDDRVGGQSVLSAFRNLLHHHVHQQGAGPAATFWTGIGAIRRETFLEAGGFDVERYPRPSIEDVELGVRIAGAGGKLELDPQLRGTHLKRWGFVDMMRTDFRSRGVPWVTLLLRERGASTRSLNLGWRHRLSALASLAAAGAVVGRRPKLAGASLLALVLLNRSFYALLARRRGAPAAAAGVGLHALHLLTAVAAVPAGVLAHLRERRASSEGGADASGARPAPSTSTVPRGPDAE